MTDIEFQKKLQTSAIAVIEIIKNVRLEAAKNIFDDFSQLNLKPEVYSAAVYIYNATNDDIRLEADQIRDALHDFIRDIAASRTLDEVWAVITNLLKPWNKPPGVIYNPDRTVNWLKVASLIKKNEVDKNMNLAKARAAYQVYRIFWETPAS